MSSRAPLAILCLSFVAICHLQAADVKGAAENESRVLGDVAIAPLHWKAPQWERFGEGVAAVAALYAADRSIYDAVQRNRSSFTNDFAKVVTPFGARRAEIISAALLAGGLVTHEDGIFDAGRDSLEAEIVAGGIVTPLFKRVVGRARPIQARGAHWFDSFESTYESFPSGHATNAFAFATAIAAHSDGWLVPTIVYTLAGGIAVARVNDRAHFPSDVLAGALIGRAVAKAIVAEHQRHKLAWSVAPPAIGKHPAMAVRLTWP